MIPKTPVQRAGFQLVERRVKTTGQSLMAFEEGCRCISSNKYTGAHTQGTNAALRGC
jgi:hypothetical protein